MSTWHALNQRKRICRGGVVAKQACGTYDKTCTIGWSHLPESCFKGPIHRILKGQAPHPYKIKHYLERRDQLLRKNARHPPLVCQDVNLQNDTEPISAGAPETVAVSVDEKPGVQAIKNIAKISLRWQESTQPLVEIMNVSAWTLFPFWLLLSSIQVT